ncbi:DUF982 domain-containing protein [Nitratireductor sp. GCM10026969]|uniref:DUF982 domain-containing protein n=1 Tax=Nitratireductor sp. GCM10026969 TaxID=3252645 RepID=UPI003613A084
MRNSWHPPIHLRLGNGGEITRVTDVFEAAHILIYRWPSRGAAHKRALDECMKALRGKVDPTEARQAFTEAARKAGIHAE